MMSEKKSSRPNKGKLQYIIDCNNYVAIDIETTGLDSMYDEIIELGAIKYCNNIEVSRFQQLVKPSDKISDFIEDLTGITNTMVTGAPSIDTVLPSYLEFIGGGILLGHNISFDINFIYDKATDLGLSAFSNDYIDTMRISHRLYPKEHTHTLSALCDRLKIHQPIEHRAIADCARTQLCYQAMCQYCKDSGILPLVERVSYDVKAKSILPETDLFDINSPIYQKVFTFTGVLTRFTRREAMQAVVNCGGIVADTVTKKTNFLVLGNNDYCKSIKDGKSNKQKKAETMILQGYDISVITENTLCDMLYDS